MKVSGSSQNFRLIGRDILSEKISKTMGDGPIVQANGHELPLAAAKRETSGCCIQRKEIRWQLRKELQGRSRVAVRRVSFSVLAKNLDHKNFTRYHKNLDHKLGMGGGGGGGVELQQEKHRGLYFCFRNLRCLTGSARAQSPFTQWLKARRDRAAISLFYPHFNHVFDPRD